MKRQLAIISFISLFAAFIFSSTLIVGGCGGGGGGGGIIGGGGLATGTFTKTDVLDDGSGANFGVFGTNDFRHYQLLYRAQEINGSGNITTVWLRLDQAEAAAISCPNTTIKLGHSSVTDLSTNMTNNVEQGRGSLVTVVNDATIVIPPGAAGDYFDIPLETPFSYNGVDNLVLDITRVTTCSDTAEIRWTAETIAFVNQAYSSDSGNPDTAGFTGNSAFDAKFTFAGGDNELDYGGTTPNFWPLATALGRAQYLYLASEIDGNGPITGIALQSHAATLSDETYTATVKMVHTNSVSLSMTWADNYTDSPTVVSNEVEFTIPSGLSAGDYFWVPIPDGNFTYDGTRNLLIDIDVSAATADTFLRTTCIAGRRVPGYHSDGDTATGSGQCDLPNIKFRFNGGTMDVLTPNGMSNGPTFPFYIPSGRAQWLYRASELGATGTINKIALRVPGDTILTDPVAETGFNYTVLMSHTSATTLGTDLATNVPSAVMVYNGTLDLPAMLLGDWIEIPLSTTFAYNGEDNLVVEISGSGGSVGNNFACSLDTVLTTLYASRWLWINDAASPTGIVQNGLSDMRFFFK